MAVYTDPNHSNEDEQQQQSQPAVGLGNVEKLDKKDASTIVYLEQMRALSIIVNMTETYIHPHLHECRTARSAMQILLKMYRDQSKSAQTKACKHFVNLRMEPEDSMRTWHGRILTAAEDFEWRGGQAIEESELVKQFFSGLLPEYRDLGKAVYTHYIARACSKLLTLSECARSLQSLVTVEKAWST